MVDTATAHDEPTRTARRAGRREIVAGHYEAELEQPLGVGGMAIVYRGRDLRTRREVALKTVRPEYRDDGERRARFRREARTMAFLSHPNVVRVYDLFESEEEGSWAVLELVRGASLKDRVRAEGALPLERVAHVLSQVASALDHLHRRGLVHLDVKPQNIVASAEDGVKLIDFGIAQGAGQPQERIAGQALGTAAYLAPEQASGEVVTPATDVYALGCVVYELVTGRLPFGRDDDSPTSLIRAHLRADPLPPSQARPDLRLPAAVDEAILRALAKRPIDRYASCLDFARQFQRAVEGSLPDGVVRTEALPAFPRRGGAAPAFAPPVGQPDYGFDSAARRRPLVRRVPTRFLWKLVLILAMANGMLALVMYWQWGEVPGVYGAETRLRAGGTARTDTDALNLRDAPGVSGGVVDVLPTDTELRIMGEPVTVDGQVWWPVTYDRDGFTVRAFAAGRYLVPVEQSGRDRFLEWARDALPT